MEVNDALVDKLAHLSKLRFNEDEKQTIKKDLQNMLTMIDKMNELNTDGVAPMLHMTDNENIFREDEIKGNISNEDALKNAAVKEAPFFIVPKVIKK